MGCDTNRAHPGGDFCGGDLLPVQPMNSALLATGAFTILLVSFYYVAQIFLLGAVSCRVYADLYGSRKPKKEAITHQI